MNSLAWLVTVSAAQAALLVAAVVWLNRQTRRNRPVTVAQRWLWLTPLVVLLAVQWWLDFQDW